MTSRLSQTAGLSAAGERSRRTHSVIERDAGAGNYEATTISFTNPGTIGDSANGLGVYQVNDTIDVRGSAGNSRRWTVTAVAAGALTVIPAMVTTEAAGPMITIQREG